MEIAQYHEINSRCSKKIWNIYEFRQGVLSQDLYKVSRFIRINIFHGFTDWVSFVMLQLKCVQIKVFTNTLMALSAKTPGDSSVGMPSALQIVLLIKIEDSWNWKINWAIINGYGFSLTLQIKREMPKCCSMLNENILAQKMLSFLFTWLHSVVCFWTPLWLSNIRVTVSLSVALIGTFIATTIWSLPGVIIFHSHIA